MANTSSSSTLKQKQKHSQSKKRQSFLDMVFSWSLSDILDKHLYKFQVEDIPLTFSSTTHYMNSFIYPLLEETHADLQSQLSSISKAPTSPVYGLQRMPTGNFKDLLYHITLAGVSYEPKVGDLVALTEVKPKCVDDLALWKSPFLAAYVTQVIDESAMTINVLSSDVIESNLLERKERSKGLFVVYLTNLTTNMRIWQALTSTSANMNIIERTFSFSPGVAIGCDKCCTEGEKGVIEKKLRQAFDSFKLDHSQEAAVLTSLSAKRCCHKNSCIKLIWGPPGTGKTKTIASLLFVLLRTKRRTLTCAPTNIAVVGVAKRLLSLVTDHDLGCDTYGFGDIVLFGNEERMKVKDYHEELLDVFLDHRIDVLANCLSLWRTYVNDMICFLKNPVNEFIVSKQKDAENKSKNKKKKNEQKLKNAETKSKNEKKNEKKLAENREETHMTFEEFAMNRFSVLGKKLVACIRNLYTHLPTSVISVKFAKKMTHLIDLIHKVGESIKQIVIRNQSLKEAFDTRVDRPHFMKLRLCKTECLQALNDLRAASFIPKSMNLIKLKNYCLMNACLIFSTASSSIKLCRNGMKPIECVLIDEAAQLKECESIIPLQLPGVQNAVLVGDERQLPPMVQSKICQKAKFGRSLFERMVLLGHQKHLLNVQYRMHPSISQFPNAEFYNGQILDGCNVIDKSHEKRFLKGVMHGSYSFINVEFGKEELDRNYSTKNMVEVAVIAEIISNLFKESVAKKQKVTVGCISPYKAQVDAIEEKLGKKYNQEASGWSFSVNVRSVDGFQGCEEDVIIFSTVRCNSRGSVGFLSSRERANVALTRARHCLWVVGNKETMIKSGSIWNTLVYDAENRGCVFNASSDKNLAQAMVHAMVELTNFGSLLNAESILFKEAKWKVNFTNTFLKRMASIANLNVHKQVVSLIVKLSNGWRQPKKIGRNSYNEETRGILDMLETYSINGHLYLVWSVDIVNQNSLCVQVLKFWDILSLPQIQKSANCLESAFGSYTYDMIKRCQTKLFERNQVLPMTWPVDSRCDQTRMLTTQLAKLSLRNVCK